MNFGKILTLPCITLAALLPHLSAAQDGPQYRVTITNITKNQVFTPIVAVGHTSSLSLFSLGEQASEEIIAIAESGNILPLVESLAEQSSTTTAFSQGLLMPGATTEVLVRGNYNDMKLSLAAMLLPTNDTFVALDSVAVPYYGSVVAYAQAYDAGSETNDELCSSIPGPQCGGAATSPEDGGEGFVHISSGIHGIADLESSVYDWRGPVAKVEIEIMY